MTAPIIDCENLTKSFPAAYGLGSWLKYLGKLPRRAALVDVSLQVKQRELFGLLGPNGAGKTTLLKLLATLLLPDRGRIIVDGVDATRSPYAIKRMIGLCTSEERSFYFRLSARENLQFFGTLNGLGGRELAQRIDEVLDLVDLRGSIDKHFDTFSSGMRQRLALARAMLPDPQILLLDEPTRGVDPLHANAMRKVLRDELVTRQGKTVVLTTNLLEEAWSICDTVAVLNGGVIVTQGSPAELSSKIGGRIRYVVSFDRVEAEVIERLRSIDGVLHVERGARGRETITVEIAAGGHALTQLLHTISANGSTVRELRPLDDGLLELFAASTEEQRL